MRLKAHTTSVLTRWLAEYLLANGGISLAEVLESVSLPTDSRISALYNLNLPQYLTLLNWAALRLGDPDFGLNLAKQTPNDAFGTVGVFIRHSETLREHFQSLQQFGLLFCNCMGFKFIEGPVTSQLEYRILLPTVADSRHDNEYTLALLTHFIRMHTGRQWCPRKVSFSHLEPANTDIHKELFGDHVSFEQAVTSFTIETKILDTPISESNPLLLSSLREQVQSIIDNAQRHHYLVSQLRSFIATTLSTVNCNAEYAALHVLLSKRSMTRHLTELGTSFRQIKQNVIQEMAKSALIESDSSIIEIALHLGFSETSAFDRSFKRMTGYAPQEYRQKVSSR